MESLSDLLGARALDKWRGNAESKVRVKLRRLEWSVNGKLNLSRPLSLPVIIEDGDALARRSKCKTSRALRSCLMSWYYSECTPHCSTW